MAFLSTKTKLSKVNRNAAKNESNPAIFTEQAWPIKDFIYDQTKISSFGTNAGNPEWARTQESLDLASSWDQPYNNGQLSSDVIFADV